MMKSIAISCSILLCMASFCAHGQGTPKAQRFPSKSGGYSMDMPYGWELKTGLRGFDCVAFSPDAPGSDDGYIPNISVEVSYLEKGSSPLEVSEKSLSGAKESLKDFTLWSKWKCPTDSLDGASLEYFHKPGGLFRLRTKKVFLSDGTFIWTLSFSAPHDKFTKLKLLFDNIEASFKRSIVRETID